MNKITKNGMAMTKEEERQDIIFGIKKYLNIGMYDKVTMLERILMKDYGMTANEIENAIY